MTERVRLRQTYPQPGGPIRITRLGTLVALIAWAMLQRPTSAQVACSYVLSAPTASVPNTGGSGSVSISTNGVGCTWTAASNAAWLVPSPASGVGNATVGYSYSVNPLTSSRSGTITVAGKTHVVTQAPGIPWSPLVLDSSIHAWFKADSIPASDRPSNLVAQWIDSSPSPSNLLASGSARPLYVANAVAGKPVVRFDGVDDGLSCTPATGLAQAQGLTIVAVRRFASVPSSLRTVASLSGGSSLPEPRITLRGNSTGKAESAARRSDADPLALAASTANVTTLFQIHAAVLIGDNGQFTQFVNGAAAGTASTTLGPPPGTSPLGLALGRAADNAAFLSGDIAEFLLVRTPVGTADRQRLEGYLAHRWALASSLPADHPYRSQQPTGGICEFTVAQAAVSVPASAGTTSIQVVANSSTCAWNASDDADWITLSPASGTGNGSITCSFTANPLALPRSANVNVQGRNVVVTQAASVPWTPDNLVNVVAWFTADSIPASDRVAGSVSRWSSQAGNWDVISTGAARPVFVPNAVGGRAVVRFDGIDDVLSSVSGDVFRDVDGCSIIAVRRAAGAEGVFAIVVNSGGNTRFAMMASQNGAVRVLSRRLDSDPVLSVLSTISSPSDFHVHWSGADFSTGILSQFVNGIPAGETTIGTGRTSATDGTLHLGRGSGASFSGDIAEALLVRGPISVADRRRLEGYLAHRHSLAGRLPADHPFRTAPPGGGACAVTVETLGLAIPSNAGQASLSLVSNAAGCPWIASSDSPWLVVSPSSGSGSATITCTFTSNPFSVSRIARISVGNRTVTVTQAASEPWLPSVIPSMEAWYRADAIPSSDRPGGLVTTWIDSAAGLNSLAASGTSRPAYLTSAQTGLPLPVVRFDGVNDFMARGVRPLLRNCNGGSLYAVRRFNSAPTTSVSVGFVATGSSISASRLSLESGGSVSEGVARRLDSDPRAAATGAAPVAGSLQVEGVVASYASGTVTRFLSGAAGGSAVTTTGLSSDTDSKGISLGGTTAGNGFLAGDLGEVALFRQALSNEDRQRLEGYLSHRWNLASSLPASHPYRSAPPGVSACTFSVTSNAWSLPAEAGDASMPVSANSPGCGWTSSENVPWIIVTNGAGTGSGSFTISHAANPLATARTATITVAGQPITVTQQAGIPWSPVALGDSVAAWYRADGIPEADRPGNSVTRWGDWRTTSSAMTAAGGARPTFVAGAIGGQSVVRFDGVDDGLSFGPIDTVAGASGISVFSARRFQSPGIGTRTVAFLSTGPNPAEPRLAIRATSQGLPQAVARRTDTDAASLQTGTAIVSNTFQVHGAVANFATGSIEQFVQGQSIGAAPITIGPGPADAPQSLSVGRSGGAASFFSGDIAEVILLRTPVATEARHKIEGYLAHRLGLGSSLPADHPYRAAPPGGGVCEFSSPPSVSVAGTGGTVAFEIAPNSAGCSWTATSPSSWIFISTAAGTGAGTVSFIAAPNPVPVGRTGVVSVGGRVVSVIQEPGPCVVQAAPSSLPLPNQAGSSSLAVTANGPECLWTCTSSQSWLTCLNPSGVGSGQLVLSYEANPLSVARTATISVSPSGAPVTVTQAAGIPWSPLALGSNVKVWFKADAIPAGDRPNNLVAQWIDSTGGGLNLSASGTAQPTFVANALAGKPVVRFDGTIDRISRSNVAILNSAPGGTVFAVRKFASLPVSVRTPVHLSTGTGSSLPRLALQASSNSLPVSLVRRLDTDNTATATGPAAVTTAFQIHGAVSNFAAGSISQFIDGGIAGSATTTTGNSSPANSLEFSLGGAGAGTNLFAGDLAEVLVAAKALTADERERLEGYLAHRWGLTANLPPSHPYRSAPPGAGICEFTLSAASASLPNTAGSGSVSVSVNSTTCSWTASSNAAWLTVSPASGTGNATISYSYQANPNAATRSAAVTVGGQVLTVTQAAAPCSFSLSASSASVPSTAGNGTFSLTANGTTCTWTASSNAAWLAISPANGTGNATITYTYSANPNTTSRSATITAGGQAFTINQAAAACSFTLSASSASVPSSAGNGSLSITANGANCAWTASSNVSWLTVSPASGTGSGTVTYTYQANPNASSRSALVTAGGQSFTVNQAAAPCSFSLSASSASVPSTAGNGTFSLAANGTACAWTASDNATWLSVSPANGAGNATITYTYSANPNTTSRSATITAGGQAFTVNQAAMACSFTLSASSASVPSSAGNGSLSITANGANCAWTASSNASWLTVSPASGTGSGTVTYTYQANPNASSRSALVTAGGQSFTVTQAAAPCSFSLSASSASVPSTAGNGTFSLNANGTTCTWTASDNAAWLSVSPANGAGNATITYTYSANPNTTSRSATITAGGQAFTVNQAAFACSFTLSTSAVTVPAAAGNGSFTISANGSTCGWTASDNATWLSVSPTSGNGNGTITYTYQSNSGSSARTATITAGGQTITVTQNPPCTFTVSTSAVSVPNGSGSGTFTISASSTTCGWTASDDAFWLFVTPTGGTGNGTITYTHESNPNGNQRTGTIIAGGRTVTVTQAALCSFSVSPQSDFVLSPATNGTLSLTASDPTCTWSASSNSAWLTVSPVSGSGTATLAFSCAMNTSSSSRIGIITVGGRTFTVTQEGNRNWRPTDFSSLSAWFKADAGVLGGGAPSGSVIGWNDSQPPGLFNLAASGVSTPVLVSAGLAGKPVIRFDGTNDGLQRETSHQLMQGVEGGSVFVVRKFAEVPMSNRHLVFINQGGSLDGNARFSIKGSGGLPIAYGRRLDSSLTTDWSCQGTIGLPLNFQIHGAVVNYVIDSHAQYIDGVTAGTSSSVGTTFSDTPAAGLAIGKSLGPSPTFFKGDIAEVLIFKKGLLDCERKIVEGYLAHRWALTGNLPSAHPFRTIEPKTNDSCALSIAGFPSQDDSLIRVPQQFATLQEAIDFARDGATISVGPGVYAGPFLIESKSLRIVADHGPAETVLDGQGTMPTVFAAVGGARVRIEGFTVKGGHGGTTVELPDGVTAALGGGVLISRSDVELAGCVIEGNFAEIGGGIGASESRVLLLDTAVLDNIATFQGGGLAILDTNADLRGGTVRGNSAAAGGGGWVRGVGQLMEFDTTWCNNHPDDLDSTERATLRPCSSCAADIDGNGAIDGSDLAAALSSLGQAGGAADLDGSGLVDDRDIRIVLESWGVGCDQ
jgi:hypothetical protein